MKIKNKHYKYHFEETLAINATPNEIFQYADNHENLASHMNTSSMMMGGGKMLTQVDQGRGQNIGSHITMSGSAFGITIYLDEVITVYEPPYKKAWETVGDIKIGVIGHYTLGFEIIPTEAGSQFRVCIDYNDSERWYEKLFGFFLGSMYAKWCVQQMTKSVRDHFV